MNIVYNKCHYDVMPTFEDKYFDFAPLDPSYGIGESKKNHKSRNTPITQKNGNILKAKDPIYIPEDWDDAPPTDEYFNQIFRISKHQFIWGANYFKQIVDTPFNPPKRKDFQKFLKDNPTNWVIWDKLNGKNDFNDCELAWTSLNVPSVIVSYLWSGMMQGISIQYGTIQKGDKSQNEKRFHPTQKPMPINNWVIKNYCPIGNSKPKIFDAGVGSGGIRISCYNFGADFIGCEKSKHMFDLQEESFKNHISLLKLEI